MKKKEAYHLSKLKSLLLLFKVSYKCKKLFVEKLLNNKEYRSRYVFVHLEPSPHFCFKEEIPFFVFRGLEPTKT